MMSLPYAPAAERNAEPILTVLRERLGPGDRILEIGSGTGQHVVRFAAALPGTCWQPSEISDALPGLSARVSAEGGPNIALPVSLDITRDRWPAGPFEACLTVNTLHIMPLEAVAALFDGVSSRLTRGGALFVYGPLNVDGAYTSEGNRAFDMALRAENAARGIRELDALERFAAAASLVRDELIAMPANNHLIVWRRKALR